MPNLDESLKPAMHVRKPCSTKKKLLICIAAILLAAAIAIALGVGLGIGLERGDGRRKHGPSAPPTDSDNTVWQPDVGTSWQIEILYPLNDTSFDARVYDIDLFINTPATMSNLHSLGRKVICYLSAGTYEDWRPDADKFELSDLGNSLPDWPGEKYVDTNSANVRDIMAARLDMARAKGCDGVDPDNVDSYANENGFGLTRGDAVDYVHWLADESHSRGLAVGLKNAGALIESVIEDMQWSINEQCAEFNECVVYHPFPQAGKPVFHIEYPKGDENNHQCVTGGELQEACNFPGAEDFSTIIKNINLNYWVQTCP